MFSKNPYVDERSPSTWKVFLILTNTLMQFGHFPHGGLTAHLLVWPEVVRLWVSLAPLLWPLLQHTQGPRVKLCKRHCRLYIGPFSLIVSNSIHNEGLLNFCWSTGGAEIEAKKQRVRKFCWEMIKTVFLPLMNNACHFLADKAMKSNAIPEWDIMLEGHDPRYGRRKMRRRLCLRSNHLSS